MPKWSRSAIRSRTPYEILFLFLRFSELASASNVARPVASPASGKKPRPSSTTVQPWAAIPVLPWLRCRTEKWLDFILVGDFCGEMNPSTASRSPNLSDRCNKHGSQSSHHRHRELLSSAGLVHPVSARHPRLRTPFLSMAAL